MPVATIERFEELMRGNAHGASLTSSTTCPIRASSPATAACATRCTLILNP